MQRDKEITERKHRTRVQEQRKGHDGRWRTNKMKGDQTGEQTKGLSIILCVACEMRY